MASLFGVVGRNRFAGGKQALRDGLVGQGFAMGERFKQFVAVSKADGRRVGCREIEQFPARTLVIFQRFGISVPGEVPGCAAGKYQWEFRSVTMRPYSDARP